MELKPIYGQRQSDLIEEFLSIGLPESKARYHSTQVYNWVFQRGVQFFDQMTDLSKQVRSYLSEKYLLDRLPIVFRSKSEDGTQKFLFKLSDGKTIESVLIPTEDRITICVSSQVGCAMGCKFCNTASQGLTRNLEPYEIVGQVLTLWPIAKESYGRPISNIVYMGMGEPLHNLENVARSVEVLVRQSGLNFSKRKITISTSGLVTAIRKLNTRLVGESRVNLAISLNGSYDAQRESVMPVNKAFPIEELLDACREFDLEPHRKITFEYVLLKDVNDSVEDAKRVIELIEGIPSKLNVIPYNPHPASAYDRPDEDRLEEFYRYLLDHGVAAMIRHSRGRDILAACGQLKSTVEKNQNFEARM
ncbi:MAG: 23S rRNA (adenine(2503)-C(2))-methyltransferase RlmN [Bacteriovoracia bacterium]